MPIITKEQVKEYRRMQELSLMAGRLGFDHVRDLMDTCDALWRVAEAAEKMNVRMSLINGPGESCPCGGSAICENHTIMVEMDIALAALRSQEAGK